MFLRHGGQALSKLGLKMEPEPMTHVMNWASRSDLVVVPWSFTYSTWRFCPKRWPVSISKAMINQWMECVCSPNFQTKSHRDFLGANMMHVSTAGRVPRILFGTSTFGLWSHLSCHNVAQAQSMSCFWMAIHVCDEGFSVHRGNPSPDPQASKPKPKPKHLTAGCSGSFRVLEAPWSKQRPGVLCVRKRSLN